MAILRADRKTGLFSFLVIAGAVFAAGGAQAAAKKGFAFRHAGQATGSESGKAVQAGIASWYGGSFNHRRTSSGHVFDMTEMTAAHPSAPLGSRLLVHSAETGRTVVVTVNDRGPYSRGRIIDLSHEAAARLGMLRRGIAHVTVRPAAPDEVVEVAQAPESSRR